MTQFSIDLNNLDGKKITTLVSESKEAVTHSYIEKIHDLTRGFYLILARFENHHSTAEKRQIINFLNYRETEN